MPIRIEDVKRANQKDIEAIVRYVEPGTLRQGTCTRTLNVCEYFVPLAIVHSGHRDHFSGCVSEAVKRMCDVKESNTRNARTR